MRAERLVTALLLAFAVALVLWIWLLPLGLPGVTDPAAAAALRYTAGDGREHVYLGDRDSYLWLRHARNILRHGSPCEAVVDGACRDTLTLAPLGATSRYAGSLHTAAIVALHRAVTRLAPQFPLPASAFLLPVLLAALGVLPAFALGRQLAGPIGGLFAAVMVGLHPSVLQRSLGADNDIWNVVLPLATVWAVSAALAAGPRAGLAYAALAGVFSSVHAAVWRGWGFTFAVVLGGLAAALAVHGLRWALRRRSARVWQAPAVRHTAAVGLAYLASAALGTGLAGAEQPALRLLAQSAGDVFAAGAGGAAAVDLWPSALATVSELRLPTLGAIAVSSYGALLFFVGWLGLLALLLPRHGWTPAHFVVWMAGNVLYRYLLTTVLDRRALLALLALPLLGAGALSVAAPADDDERDVSPALLLMTWFLAALYLSYDGLRFILLLAAPFGVAAGVAVGRLHLWLAARAARLPAAAVAPARALVWIAALAVLLLPLRSARANAGAYLPMIDDAWVETFERLRETTPPQAIVNTWWDYGYWAQYYAERPVSADGSTLLTHVPHWLARAQTSASAAEMIGLLRMLDCGSDAPPPEGGRGAFAQLVDRGLGELGAYNAVVALAGLDRAGADAHLAGLGLDPAARAAVLAATHCQPPPAHLVLSSAQGSMSGWWHLGRWEPNRAYLARVLVERDRDAALAVLTGELGYSPQEAARLYETARGLASEAAIGEFVSPPQSLLTTAWVPCAAVEDGQRRCTINLRDRRGATVADVHYPAADPLRARLNVTHPGAGQPTETAPGLLLVAEERDVRSAPRLSTADAQRAVLIDARQHRVLVGTPGAIESLYTRLMYLDGLGVSGLRKVDERQSPRGERVVTWAIDW